MRLSLLGLAPRRRARAAGGPPSPVARAPARREVRLHYTAQDREVGRYQYVPFASPAGATRLTVTYAYDKAGGANVVDLGLFEPGSLDLGTPAFRGWSGGGGIRDHRGHGRGHAGVLARPAPAGEWHVLLGLYKVGRQAWTSPSHRDVLRSRSRARAHAAPRPTGPLRAGPAWYSGGVHLHTRHSDGELSTAEVCRRAREAGLDFVVITDHNNTTHQLDPVDVPGLLAHRGRGDHHARRACERLRPRRLARPGGLPPHRRRRADP